jgi:Polyketide cyclase / dehydrase and lipid transport
MLKKIGVVVVVLIAAVLAYAATKPDTFHVQRSTSIQAPAEKIFPLIDDFRQQASWSPWEKMDPAMKKSLSGAPSGKGAAYEWDGNSQVGKGRIEITDSTPTSKVAMKLDMFTPFEAHNNVEFTLDATGGSTRVTWAMYGPQPFIAKVMSVFMDCDKMVGQNFEAGLANLKAIAEK